MARRGEPQKTSDGVIAGLILAAGAGTRFASGASAGGAGGAGGGAGGARGGSEGAGDGGGGGGAGARGESASKLLAEVGGRPLLEWAVEAMCAVRRVERVVVVLGAFADEVGARLSCGRATSVVCPDWREGQAASLRCGLGAVAGADRVIVTLGDEPLITPAIIERFLDAAPGTRAVYNGRPGHPVLLGQHHMSALSSLTGDRGARDLLRGGPTIECGDLSSGRDVDTPEDLEAIRDETRAVL